MNNKNIFKTLSLLGVLVATFAITACTDYDDEINAANNRIDNLETRVSALEKAQKVANDNITSLQSIVNNISYDGYVVDVTEIEDGYTLTFGDGRTVTIHNGKDGVNGKNGIDAVFPDISVKQDTDGNWYWTLDGEWLLDTNNNKVRANGEKGEPGEDGDNIEFIYCLSTGMPAHPIPNDNMTDEEYDNLCAFFENIDKARKANPLNPSEPVNEGLDIANIRVLVIPDSDVQFFLLGCHACQSVHNISQVKIIILTLIHPFSCPVNRLVGYLPVWMLLIRWHITVNDEHSG